MKERSAFGASYLTPTCLQRPSRDRSLMASAFGPDLSVPRLGLTLSGDNVILSCPHAKSGSEQGIRGGAPGLTSGARTMRIRRGLTHTTPARGAAAGRTTSFETEALG